MSKEKGEQGRPQEDPTNRSHRSRVELYVLQRSLRVHMYSRYSAGKCVCI
jgi:hypothetical protein